MSSADHGLMGSALVSLWIETIASSKSHCQGVLAIANSYRNMNDLDIMVLVLGLSWVIENHIYQVGPLQSWLMA